MITEIATLKVVKRDGKKVDFLGTKIAVAIKKGFDATSNDAYSDEDVNKVFRIVYSRYD